MKKILGIFSAGLCALALMGCAQVAESKDGSASEQVASVDPTVVEAPQFKPGEQWVFEGWETLETVENGRPVVSADSPHKTFTHTLVRTYAGGDCPGAVCAVLRADTSFGVRIYYYNVDTLHFFRMEYENGRTAAAWSVDDRFVKFPLRIGESWSFSKYMGERSGNTVFTRTATGWEDVTVAAGTCRAVRLEATTTHPDRPALWEAKGVYYYCPAWKRIIKSDERDAARNHHYVLLKYIPATVATN